MDPENRTAVLGDPIREAAKFLSTLAAKEASLPEIRQRHDMDDDHQELVRHLFAAATALIETAHDAAIAGQSGAIAAGDYAEAAHRLQGAARDIAALAEAAAVIVGPSDGDSSGNPDQTQHLGDEDIRKRSNTGGWIVYTACLVTL